MSVTLSLCMIVKDDAAVLERCLASVSALCDEIIILDTGSKDDTVEIARRYAKHVLRHPWNGDFAAARNASFAYASGDYLLRLDADEAVSIENLRRLMEWKDRDFDHKDMIALRCMDGFDAAGAASCWQYCERIFRRAAKPVWQGFVCEYADWSKDIRLSDLVVTRQSDGRAQTNRIFAAMKKQMPAVRRDPRIRCSYARILFERGELSAAERELRQALQDACLTDLDRYAGCMLAARIARAKSDAEADIRALLEALRYGTPSAELACEIGGRLADAQRWREAAYWYALAPTVPIEPRLPVLEEAHGFLPYIMLTECYMHLNEPELARQYFTAAESLKPDNKYVVYYRNYFES